MRKKYPNLFPRLVIINSQNFPSFPFVQFPRNQQSVQRAGRAFETGSRGDFAHAAISIPRHEYVAFVDPFISGARNKISAWTYIFVSVGWRVHCSPAPQFIGYVVVAHNPRRATVSRVVRFNVAASRFVPRFDTRAPVRRALFARFDGNGLQRLVFWKRNANWASFWKKKKKKERICFSKISNIFWINFFRFVV